MKTSVFCRCEVIYRLDDANFSVALCMTKEDSVTIDELTELVSLIESLPNEYKESFTEAVGRAAESIDRRRRILGFIQESLTQLRLDMKSLMFDLEATRRERDALQRRLENFE